MKTSILTFALAIGVSLSLALDYECFASYSACQQGLQSLQNLGDTGDNCSKVKGVLKCLLDASIQCGDGFQEVFEGLQSFVDEACLPGSTTFADLQKVSDCLTKNIQSFKGCSMDGEANNLGELCGLAEKFLKCYTAKAKEVCSPAEVLEKLLNPFIKSATTCSNKTDVVFDSCKKAYIKCGLKALSNGEVKCTDLQKFGKCFLEVPADCNPLSPFTPYFEKYLSQIPDYCNSESPFRKNFDKSSQCILPKLESIRPCSEKFQGEAIKLKTSGITDANDYRMKVVRLQEQLISCILKNVGTPCGKEAEAAVRFLMKPAEDIMDETCLKVTKKRCNGASGITNASWLLLFGVMFLLTRYYE